MGNLLDFFSGGADEAQPRLKELRLGQEPAMIMAFTADASEARLHWIDDPAVKTFVVCPGKGCPVCHLGSDATKVWLLPVYDVEGRDVKVLRITMRLQPGGLGACLIPHLNDKAIAQKVLFVKRDGTNYSVIARPFTPLADRGEQVVGEFLAAQRDGLKLESAFRSMTAVELSEVPPIANKLAALGSWKAPDADTEAAATGDGAP
ncbi:MAG: hypothetical protein ABIP94_06175 [Planctomycetota bacterium]